MTKDIGVYIHIPFCVSKCYYCDFNSFAMMDELIDAYVDSLCKEILSKADILSEYEIKTIYFGGGTPSYIDSKHIIKILKLLNLFNVNPNAEISIEVNPNSASYEKLLSYKNAGINRISIGVQSLLDKTLKLIGRKHTTRDFINVLDNCKKLSINNISCDLMYPLPDLNSEEFKKSIDDMILLTKEYDIKHISVYNLEVHDNTRLKFLLDEGFVKLVDEDEEYEMKLYMDEMLEKNGLYKYEISNYAKPGFESKHNINYWNQGYYLGFGAGSSSFFGSSRYTNERNIRNYISQINEGRLKVYDRDDMDTLDMMKEYIILRLRLKEGVNLQDFKSKFGKNLLNEFEDQIRQLNTDGLIVIDKNNIRLSTRGSEVANIVWEEFI